MIGVINFSRPLYFTAQFGYEMRRLEHRSSSWKHKPQADSISSPYPIILSNVSNLWRESIEIGVQINDKRGRIFLDHFSDIMADIAEGLVIFFTNRSFLLELSQDQGISCEIVARAAVDSAELLFYDGEHVMYENSSLVGVLLSIARSFFDKEVPAEVDAAIERGTCHLWRYLAEHERYDCICSSLHRTIVEDWKIDVAKRVETMFRSAIQSYHELSLPDPEGYPGVHELMNIFPKGPKKDTCSTNHLKIKR
ncbi:MAG: hypothetical protein ABIE74_04320 [Pseudomonadota bacterium]